MRSTTAETDLGKVAITPRSNDQDTYDILDLIEKDGRCYLSLKIGNTADIADGTAWMKTTENTYDIAVRHGYKGTEAQWLASLSSASEDAAQLANKVIEKCEEATKAAQTATTNATNAASRLNKLSDNRDKIIDGQWWRYDEETGQYKNTGETANGNVLFALFGINPDNGLLSMSTHIQYAGPSFAINEKGELILTI